MLKTVSNILAATLVAATTFGASAVFAGGDYYVGGSPDAVKSERQTDGFRTNSIGSERAVTSGRSVPAPYDRGDYRPVGIGN